MTTIVAIEKRDHVVIGWDTQTTAGNETWQSDKVFAVGDDLVIGASGPTFVGQLLRCMKPPALDTWDVDRWMTRQFAPAFADELDRYKLLCGTPPSWGGRALVVARGRVYLVHSDLSWSRRPSGLYAIGSGADYALGAMTVGADAHAALEAAALYDPGTSAPLRVAVVLNETGHPELITAPGPTAALEGAPA